MDENDQAIIRDLTREVANLRSEVGELKRKVADLEAGRKADERAQRSAMTRMSGW